jgi:hypothetical protein
MEELTGEWRTAFGRVLNGRSAVRQRGKKGRERGVRSRECYAARGCVVGPGPDRWVVPGSGPSVARAGNVRRARVAGRKQRGGELTGGPRHSVRRRCR